MVRRCPIGQSSGSGDDVELILFFVFESRLFLRNGSSDLEIAAEHILAVGVNVALHRNRSRNHSFQIWIFMRSAILIINLLIIEIKVSRI